MTPPDPNPPVAAVDELPASLTYVGRPSTAAVMSVRHHARRERVGRALRTLGACWGLAIVTVLVPVLHFVLVPGLLIAGPLVALQRLRERMTVIGARGDCPGCGAPQDFAVGSAPAPRMALRCATCSRQVFLEPNLEAPRAGS